MKQNWLVKNIVNNILVVFVYLFLQVTELSVVTSLFFAYLCAMTVNTFLFPIPKEIKDKIEKQHPGEKHILALLIMVMIISLVNAFIVSYFWDIFVKIGIDESTGLITAILIYNAVCTLADKFMMKVVEEELDNKF